MPVKDGWFHTLYVSQRNCSDLLIPLAEAGTNEDIPAGGAILAQRHFLLRDKRLRIEPARERSLAGIWPTVLCANAAMPHVVNLRSQRRPADRVVESKSPA